VAQGGQQKGGGVMHSDPGLIQRELTRFKLQRLGDFWDMKLRKERRYGRSAKRVAADYGLEIETIAALVPPRIRKRKP
jgi:hypothetical protein